MITRASWVLAASASFGLLSMGCDSESTAGGSDAGSSAEAGSADASQAASGGNCRMRIEGGSGTFLDSYDEACTLTVLYPGGSAYAVDFRMGWGGPFEAGALLNVDARVRWGGDAELSTLTADEVAVMAWRDDEGPRTPDVSVSFTAVGPDYEVTGTANPSATWVCDVKGNYGSRYALGTFQVGFDDVVYDGSEVASMSLELEGECVPQQTDPQAPGPASENATVRIEASL